MTGYHNKCISGRAPDCLASMWTGCWVCRSSGSSSLRNCRQTARPTTDHWHSYCWPTWFLLRWPCYLELPATTDDWHVSSFRKLL